MMIIPLDTSSVESYQLFLKIKSLPRYRIVGHTAEVPDEYAALLGMKPEARAKVNYRPIKGLFDYQSAFSKLAIRKRKFCLFIECGYGKTPIIFEHALAARKAIGPERNGLIVSPLNVIDQTIGESRKFYKDYPIEQVRAHDLAEWMTTPHRNIGITNYEAITDDIPQGLLGYLGLDESSMLKSAYGKWGTRLLTLGRGLDWKLAATGTPAPNDRIEFANHAVFMDAFPTVNSFLARFFVNRGQTNERWEMKAHALNGFYRALSDWSVFMTNPATYGFKDNAGTLPPIDIQIHDVELTATQEGQIRAETGMMFMTDPGGIVSRGKLARIAKSGDSLKPAFIRSLIESWPERSTIIWCKYNPEQDQLAKFIPGAASIQGSTKMEKRAEIIRAFQAGEIKTVVSKPEVLGFGLNLQIATRHIFSTLQDSWEDFHQAVKRSNRVGSTESLGVHIPITEAERPMVETVLKKAHRINLDTIEQEAMFKDASF
jgi:hypothetical protein